MSREWREPAGLGAVVQDDGGALWVMNGPNALGLPWRRASDGVQRRFDQIATHRVLSEGWRP